jgi:Mn-dependent DtxR family transcriptional regulator
MEQLIEIARSFSYKLNVGKYQTADFFCSQKAEVPESQATETSEKLYEFCKAEVIKNIKEYVEKYGSTRIDSNTGEEVIDYKEYPM